jgi:hypothetical protein
MFARRQRECGDVHRVLVTLIIAARRAVARWKVMADLELKHNERKKPPNQ